jgi:hypothetical protein
MSFSTIAAARQKLMKLSATLLTTMSLTFFCCADCGSMTTSKSDCSWVIIRAVEGGLEEPGPELLVRRGGEERGKGLPE